MIIKVAQHIYGNVEQELSPNKVGGFQTLFYTKTFLSEDESEEIEEKLVYYLSVTNPIKLLFFSLAEEKIVLSRVVPLADIDKFGREGSYLAHSLLLSVEEFIKVKCNPFVIFNLFRERFLNNAAGALERGDPESANINEITLEIEKENLEAMEMEIVAEAQKWAAIELKKIAHYTINYKELKDKRESLVIAGNPGQIENALKIAFMFVPGKIRLNCSFDTHFHGCNPVRNYFWATGYNEAPGTASHLILVNSSHRKVSAESPVNVSLHEEWVFECISQQKFLDIISYNLIALELQKFLLENEYDEKIIRKALPGLPGDFFSRFFKVYRVPLAKTLKKKCAEAVGIKLALRLLDKYSSYSTSQPKKLFRTLFDGFDLNRLAGELYDTFKPNIKGKPGRQEMQELQSLLKKTEHDYLNVLIAAWQEDDKSLSRHLAQLSDSSYREIMELLIKESLLPPDRLIATEKVDIFLEIFVNHFQTGSEIREHIPNLIKKLIILKQGAKLLMFSPVLNKLPIKQIQTIKEIVEKHEPPTEFLEALNEKLPVVKESSTPGKPKEPVRGFWGKFKLFGKKE